MGATQSTSNDLAQRKKELKTEAEAQASDARRIQRQIEASTNPVNMPGSLQLSLNRPSQLPVRDTSRMFEITPYGPPRRGDGRQTITTYKPASTARNPYAGLPVAPTKEDLKDKKSYSAFLNKNAAAIDERMAAYQKWEQENKSQYTTRTEDDLDRFNANQDKQQAIRDRVRNKQEAEEEKNNAVKRDLAEAKRTGEPVSVQDGKFDVGDKRATLQIRKPPEPYKVPQWQKDITKKYKSIGDKDSRENKAYVNEYKRKTALGEKFDPMELADEVMKGFNSAPPARPAMLPMQTPPAGSGTGNYLPPGGVPQSPATPRPAPATPTPALATPATPTPATPSPTPAPATPAPAPAPANPAPAPGSPYSPSGSPPALIEPTNPLPDGVTLAEPPSFDPSRPIFGGKSTLPPGYFASTDPNEPLYYPNPINPYAPVMGRLTGNTDETNPSSYYSYAPTDPNDTIDLDAVENFDLPSYNPNPTKKPNAKPSAPQTKRSRLPFEEPALPVKSTDDSASDSNLMPPEMNVYTPVEKKKKRI